MFFDPIYLIGPAVLLGIWAQMRIRSTYSQAQQLAAPFSGAIAARQILDSAGLTDVGIEQVSGHLSDHYDPREKILRLSPEVYQSNSLAAVGIAAHEAGHALQDAENYAPLVIRNAVVPIANFGSGAGIWMFVLGLIFGLKPLVMIGAIVFGTVVFFQVVNLPVEFNASARAKDQLVTLGIVPPSELTYISKVLNAAALTYVAATLQSVATLLYLVMRAGGLSSDE